MTEYLIGVVATLAAAVMAYAACGSNLGEHNVDRD